MFSESSHQSSNDAVFFHAGGHEVLRILLVLAIGLATYLFITF